MSQIKDTNVIKTEPVILNPVFFMPPDVIDVRAGFADEIEEESTADIDIIVDSGEVIDPDRPAPDATIPEDEIPDLDIPESLPTPEEINVISQTVRIAPDGKAVVDVVIEIVDSEGTTEYDIRVTK